MTVIKVEAGREHIIKVGEQELRVTLRPHEIQYLPFIREALAAAPPVVAKAFMDWLSAKTVITVADVLEITDAFIGTKTMPFKAELRNVLSTVDKFLKL